MLKDLVRWLKYRATSVEYHTKCPHCEEPMRFYARGLSPEQAKEFLADCREQCGRGCEECR